ncbi:DUF320 domain-containing protein [Streptomyces sp. JH14]|uniref:chaplin n=1 Tax=Streptomyces sp. JH14 TaxID=2793630 RepID=UPI0023F719DE|nr:chaplin family protein [Streptomyces sp. JH14]MDF6045685.1 DUF320 domain-containing protein [Streptomyces sp. JH14]
MLVMAAASGILTAAGGYAYADSSAAAAAIDSSGFGSGNAVQVPVDIPINLCGNTVNVVGLLNPAVGNKCENEDDARADGGYDEGADAGYDGYDDGADAGYDGYDDGADAGYDGYDGADASAEGATVDSSGVLSGNLIQAPVDIPVNVCGNTVNVIAALNPAAGNKCSDESSPTPHYPPHHNPPHYPPHHNPPHYPPHHNPPTTHQPPSHHHHPDCPPEHHKPPYHRPPHHKPPYHKPPYHRPPHHKPPVYNPPVSHQWPHHEWDHKKWDHKKWDHKRWDHKPPTLAHTGASTDMGIAGGASAAMVIGGAWLMRRARGSQS